MLSSLIRTIFYIIIIYTFLLGGTLQFFLGLSNTITSALTAIVCFLIYLLIFLIRKKIIINPPVLFAIVFCSYILLNGFLNQTSFIEIMLYWIYVFIPLGCYLLIRFSLLTEKVWCRLFTFFLFIASIQLPILLLQKFGYAYLISIKTSTEIIAPIDFQFGTFFLKNDHALGFFLLCMILFLLFNKLHLRYVKTFALYLTISIFFTNSEISMLLAFLVWAYYIWHILNYKKIAIIIFFSAIIAIPVSYYAISNHELEGKISQISTDLSLDKAQRMYERKEATRQQTIIVLANEKLKIIGEGPYTYFNILSGKFSQNPNFSQIIWFYYDLGLVGVIFLFSYILSFYFSIKERVKYAPFIFFILCIYALFANVLADLAFMIIFLIFIKLNILKTKHEPNSNPIPRLAKN